MIKKLLILLVLIILSHVSPSGAEISTASSKNYLYILVHSKGTDSGIFDGRKKIDLLGIEYSRLKQSLENEFNLSGYVYSYDFSNNEMEIERQGWELGNRNYNNPGAVDRNTISDPSLRMHKVTRNNGKGRSMLEQAREDFKSEFKKKHNDRDPTEAEIPSKYIIIAHSMGGLAARHYIYGKGSNGQRYYQNDIAKVVFISTPQLGANGVIMKKAWDAAENNSAGLFLSMMGTTFMSGRMLGYDHPFTRYLAISSAYVLASPSANTLFSSIVGLGNTPAFGDLRPGSNALEKLNSANPDDEYNPIFPSSAESPYDPLSYRTIYGNGFCAPSRSTVDYINLQRAVPPFAMGMYLINTLGLGGQPMDAPDASETAEGRIMSFMLSMMSGYPILSDGDLLTDVRSNRGVGINTLKDTKIFPHTFRSAGLQALEAEIAGLALILGFVPNIPSEVKTAIIIGGALAGIVIAVSSEDLKEMMWAHGTILNRAASKMMKYEKGPPAPITEKATGKWIVDEKTNSLLTQALFDLSAAGDVRCPGKKDFKLLTDFSTIEGKNTGDYRKVEIKTYNESKDNNGISIIIDGKRRIVNSVMAKEPPTRIEGALRDFMPQKMQYLQYSENFAAWKDIGVINDFGHFSIDGLKLAEGQNVIAFRAKNKVGYASNQILAITINTIPMQPSGFLPAPNSFTNNNKPQFEVNFAKASYSSASIESVSLTKAILRNETIDTEIDITADVQKIQSGGAYDKHLKILYKPKTPLADGKYTIFAIANSNVGISQALWTVTVDTRGPTVSIDSLKPYSPRAPALIKYSASDESSSVLGTSRCDLYDKSGKYITQIASDEGINGGEHSFSWDGARVPDGNYIVKIKVFDLAGNYKTAETPLTIDSTPPTITAPKISPTAMSSKFDRMGVEANVSENSQVIIKLKNKSGGSTNAYLSQASTPLPLGEGKGVRVNYSWQYDNSFSPGPEDGIYDIELSAIDEAGNQSTPVTIESYRIDRTAPVVFEQITMPYVLSNSGANPYSTTLSYKINSKSETLNKLENQKTNIKIKLYNSTTGQLIKTWIDAPTSLGNINYVEWNANSNNLAKGSYKFQIIAEDDLGNQSVAYATCVKDGIAPVISFPYEDNADVSGTISIRGTAVDPDWTNSKPFKQYRVYYAKGSRQPTIKPEQYAESWRTDAIQIPQINAAGKRPVQNDSTLAYLNTNYLENGIYTILVVVDEDGGESAASTRVVNVNNEGLIGAGQNNPYIKLSEIPPTIDFSEKSAKLKINFLNSVKPSNVYIEIFKPSPTGRGAGGEDLGEVIFYKYYSNMPGSPFSGKPNYKAGSDLGYFIWQDQSGFHLRFSSDGRPHKITGSIVFMKGQSANFKDQGLGAQNTGNYISWDKSVSGEELGFDFSSSGQFMITAKIDGDPNSPSPYASNIYLGITKTSQDYLPIVIDAANNEIVDLMNLASGSSGQTVQLSSPSFLEWDGKLDTGGYADSGNYIVRAIAEGADGFGISTDEAQIKISTPFELLNVDAVNKNFSSLSMPDRVSVFYSVSKDSIVSSYVYDESGILKSTLIENEKVFGGTNPGNRHSISWKGNYPKPDSATILTSGGYKIKIIARAADGSDQKEQTIPGISIIATSIDAKKVLLDPIGKEVNLNGQTIRHAEGESPYYFEAKASGLYYPPKDFNFTLSAKGRQRFTTYPFVPFAGLMHRGFRQVDVKAVIRIKVHGYVSPLRIVFDPLPRAYRVKEGREFEDIQPFVYKIRDSNFKEEERDFRFDDRISRAIHEDGGYGLEWAECSVKIYSKDGSILLDETKNKWIRAGASEVSTDKGIFKIKIEGVVHSGGFRYHTKTGIKLADEISYSRLTNRFVPWIGFVNKNKPTSEDFTKYLSDIQKGLGFPGELFFTDSAAKPGAAYPDMKAKAAALSGEKWTDLAAKLNTIAKESNLLGYKDSLASTAGYDKYLSGEYFEFIPITSPDGGSFEKVNDSKWTAKTGLALYQKADGEKSQTQFIFNWPSPDFAWFDAKYKIGGSNYNELINNPQNYSGYANLENKCYYELDREEINSHGRDKSSYTTGATITYNKNSNKSDWNKEISSLDWNAPPYLEAPAYEVSGGGDVKVELHGTDRKGMIYAYDPASPLAWTSSDDATLYPTNGLIKSGLKIFNGSDFRSKRDLVIFKDAPYKVSKDISSSDSLKYTFLNNDKFQRTLDSPCDNPNLTITGWDVKIKDRNNSQNTDLAMEAVKMTENHMRDSFTLKLKSNSKEKRFVEISGQSTGPYTLMYFDGSDWKHIHDSDSAKSGALAWWDVSRLNGKYTVLLKSDTFISTQDISIGTIVKNDNASHEVFSAYRRAQLSFPAGAFSKDTLATITPVSMTEIKIRNKPIILTHGPIVEIKPSPSKFKTPQEDGIDLCPTLNFYYSIEDLKSLGITPNPASPEANLGLNIHQITSAGDLQIIGANKQSYDLNNKLYCFSGPLDHFSTYTLAKGKISLSAPIVFADRYITNKETVSIYGTAEPNSILEIYSRPLPLSAQGRGVPEGRGEVGADGRFHIDGVLLQAEGINYIYVVSYKQDNPDFKTQSDVEVVKDTIPPTAEAKPNLYGFSPNGDGKYESVDYFLKTNENGKMFFQMLYPLSALGRGVPEGRGEVLEISAEANMSYKLTWNKDGFALSRLAKDGANWDLIKNIKLNENISDGAYSFTVYSIDEAGNISNNIIGQTIVDTTPPKVLGINASPNPFTPNDDGIKDTTNFWYKLSEPAYVNLNIYRDDGKLFKNHLAPTEDFKYPTSPLLVAVPSGAVLSVGSYKWDGRGARNELIGGKYSYYIKAEDWVGNISTSEIGSIVVDREPTLIPYGFAEPDPFSPGNPENNFTDIKYYIARDNVAVSAYIVGNEGKYIKILGQDQLQNKGEHALRWFGDFENDYDGSKSYANKYRVGDGSYQFIIYANDLSGGKTAESASTVVVDTIPPSVNIKAMKVDYSNKRVDIKYSIPEKSIIKMTLVDESGNYESLGSPEAKDSGTYEFTYNFDNIVPSSTKKYFRIIAEDRAKNISETTTEVFSFSAEGLQIAGLRTNPQAFSPNGDGIKDQVRINYGIVGGIPEYKASINILGAGGMTIKKLIEQETQNSSNYSFYWDGKNDSGNYVVDGNYEIQIIAEDSRGNRAENRAQIIVIAAKPSITFAVSGGISDESVMFDYAVDYPIQYISGEASVKIDVLNLSSEAVWRKSFSHTPGSYNYSWNRLLNTGAKLNDGIYFARAYAIDPIGSYSVPIIAYLIIGATGEGSTLPPLPPLPTIPTLPGTSETPVIPGTIEVSPIIVDIVPPIFSSVECIVNNLDFNRIAKEGSEVSIIFRVNEALKFNPETKINGRLAAYGSQLTTNGFFEFTYKYIVAGDDNEGLAAISISGFDLANNYGEYSASSTEESFIVDITNPVIGIPDDPALIAYPGSFSMNANPDGSHKPRETTLKYSIIEPSYVTVKVYKVPNSQLNYSPADFNTQSYVSTLVTGEWQSVGVKDVIWHGEGNAGPGKYAFIVEGRDKAGNSTLKKYGGTVWIQNNVLNLREPEQYEYEQASVEVKNNPDPGHISPNGNSNIPSQKKAILYFMIPVFQNPTAVLEPEKISAQAVVAETVKVGKYSVKVYSDESAENLVRIITNEADAWGNALSWEIWDGKDDSGQYVSDGTYYLAVDVKDFAGNPAVNNHLTRAVVVDNTPPTVSSLSIDNYYFSPGPGSNSTIKSTTLTYEVSDNYINLKINIDACKDQQYVANLVNNEVKSSGKYSVKWSPQNVGTANGNTFLDGKYQIKVSAVDLAGNSAEAKQHEVIVDTQNPSFEPTPASRAWMTSDIVLEAKAFGGDSGIKNSQYVWSNSYSVPILGWTSFGSGQILAKQEEGSFALHLKAEDNAGNTNAMSYGYYRKDNSLPSASANPTSCNWQASDIAVDLSATDEFSGVVSSQYAWSNSMAVPASWNSFSNGTLTQTQDGIWYLHSKITDQVGKVLTTYFGPYRKDNTSPSLSATPSSKGWAASDISAILNVSDASSGVASSQYAWDTGTSEPASGWANFVNGGSVSQSSSGTWYLHVKAVDNVGKTATTYFGPYRKDNTAPVIDAPSWTSFNPYLATVSRSFSVSESQSGTKEVLARIEKTDGTLVKNLGNLGNTGAYTATWNGQNDANDFVNDGTYRLTIIASDNAGNTSTNSSCQITLADDQKITSGTSPSLLIDGNLYLRWINGSVDYNGTPIPRAYTSRDNNASYGVNVSGISETFIINYAQNVSFNLFSSGGYYGGPNCHFEVRKASDNSKVAGWDLYGSLNQTVNANLSPGQYYLWVMVQVGVYSSANIEMKANYLDRKYKQYSKSCAQEYQKNIAGAATSSPTEVNSYSTGPTQVGNEPHKVSSSGGDIYYQRGNSALVKISIGDSPCIAVDNSNNAYVAWHQTGIAISGNPTPHFIFFQKIPSNFAPIKGTVSLAVNKDENITTKEVQAKAGEKPTLLEPADASTVTTLRPTFKWTGIRGMTNYELRMSELGTVPDNISTRKLAKTITLSEATPSDGTNPTIAYSIHEFDEGLSKGIWHWKVLANPSTTLESSSDIWSFTVDPPLSLTGIANYPNPFNPNKERTKIRYRLGKEADEVKIRIYDITGALVCELDGTTNGEGSSIWNKYNDVSWAGRNGRGDLVLNGIYPFEIIAKLNDQTATGRGKIAVLK